MLHQCATILAASMIGRFDEKMPDFSWETLPVAYHGANYDKFSNASLHLLAKFPAVTLEKCQGWRSSVFQPACKGFGCTSCCEENVYANVGAQIKALNPRTKVIAYWHSNKGMPWYHVTKTVNTTQACVTAANSTGCANTGPPEMAPFFDFRKPAGATEDHRTDGRSVLSQRTMRTGHMSNTGGGMDCGGMDSALQ